ncbi:MAG: FAD-binding oxidoreductase [Thiolinea sp.]
MNHALQELQAQLPRLIFKQPDEFTGHDSGFHPDNLNAGLMALPTNTEQVSALLTQCNEKNIAVVPQGGRTGLAGATITTPEQIILDTRKLNQIIDIDSAGGTVLTESGVPLETLEQAVNHHGLSCGIDLAARGSATIGGMVATNAGGIEAFRNGMMRHQVLGLEVVLADGRILSDLKRVTKANEGYDLKQLFIGAEGTLGVITKVTLALKPLQTNTTTALVSCSDADHAVALFRHLHNQTELLSAEIMWPDYAHTVAKATGLESTLDFAISDTNNQSVQHYDKPNKQPIFVLIEAAVTNTETPESGEFTEILMELLEAGRIENALLAKNHQEREAIWRIREDSAVIDTVYPDGYWYDVSVPLKHLPAYADSLFGKIKAISPDLTLFLFAHLGDGNLHATISAGYPITALETAIRQAVYAGLTEMGGSFSAEHGIGTEKFTSLPHYIPETNYALMQDIKKLFDPNCIMNPGKVI